MLAGSVGAAALVALPAQVIGAVSARAAALPGTAAATLPGSAAALPHFFIYGIPGPAEAPGPSMQAARAPATGKAAAAGPLLVATQLAALPAQSPDNRFLALAAIQESAAGMTVTVSVVDVATAVVVASGTLNLPHVTSDSMLLVTPTFAANSATVGLVLSVTVPTNTKTVSKLNPRSGKMLELPASTWTSHHELAYFDVGTSSFAGPFDLADAPSLARVTTLADDKHLYLWTVPEARPTAAGQAFKSVSWDRPVPSLAAYPLGSGRPSFSVLTADPWPVSGEPVTLLPSGEFARLAYARTVQVYSPADGHVVEYAIPGLSLDSAKPGAPFMQLQPNGTVLMANPAIGRAVIADPAGSFRAQSVISFPAPLYRAGGPASKVALSPDGKTLYVLGSAKAGGLAAYDVGTGRLAASYSHGVQYTGLYQVSGTLIATAGNNPRLTFFSSALEPFSSLNTDLHVTEVF
ncbi:MAG TPA: hypothetical protein VEL03_04475 [Streptosporangiaceae bacterium]|nr:hypothetical protein [Streptosporangiaceae bacterium]